jgi:hypothetical protein
MRSDFIGAAKPFLLRGSRKTSLDAGGNKCGFDIFMVLVYHINSTIREALYEKNADCLGSFGHSFFCCLQREIN